MNKTFCFLRDKNIKKLYEQLSFFTPLLLKNEQFRFNDLLNYYYKYNQTLHVLPFLSRKHFDILKTKINPFDSKLNYSMLLTYSYIYIYSRFHLKT